MNEGAKQILTVVLSYIISRTGYWLFDFNPANYFSSIIGYIIDIAIWLTLYYVIMLLLKKLTTTNLAKTT